MADRFLRRAQYVAAFKVAVSKAAEELGLTPLEYAQALAEEVHWMLQKGFTEPREAVTTVEMDPQALAALRRAARLPTGVELMGRPGTCRFCGLHDVDDLRKRCEACKLADPSLTRSKNPTHDVNPS